MTILAVVAGFVLVVGLWYCAPPFLTDEQAAAARRAGYHE